MPTPTLRHWAGTGAGGARVKPLSTRPGLQSEPGWVHGPFLEENTCLSSAREAAGGGCGGQAGQRGPLLQA